MGILDAITSIFGGDKNDKDNLLTNAIDFIQEKAGGLEGLVDQFKKNGFGDIIDSWIGTGENQKITPEQMKDAIGKEHVSLLAEKTGLNIDDLTKKLSEIMPDFINKITPDGKLPDGDWLQKGKDILGNFFGGEEKK